VVLAGIVLGACSGTTENATAPSDPETSLTAVNPLEFHTSTTNLFFNVTGETPAPQTVEVGGLVVTTTPYVRVLSINYSPSNVKNWIRISQRPGLLEDGTLGVRLTFSIRSVPGLVEGASATVPITVPGARNGPQVITISTSALNCPVSMSLAYPSQNPLVGNLEFTDCLGALQGWEYEDEEDLTPFDLYTVVVPGNTTFTVFNRGVASNGGTLYESPFYDSRIVWTNASSEPKLYYLLASVCCGGNGPGNYGTYSIDIWSGDYYPYGAPSMALSAAAGGGQGVFKSAEEARRYVQLKARESRRGPQ
jgi:hypothetical protein